MIETDLLVLGAGAGGLTAAITAASLGQKVVVVEKSEYLGGTMALSGGGIWIPGNPHMVAEDSIDAATTYLQALLGNQFDGAIVRAFLANAPEMVRYLEANTETVRFFAADFMPDYEPSVAGAAFGRTMSMPHFDAAELGEDFAVLRPPLSQLTVLGGMQVDAGDLNPLLERWSSRAAFMHTTKLVLRHVSDWLRSGRGRVLKSGNGVAARMIRAARDKGVVFHRNCPAQALIEQDGRIVGAKVELNGKIEEIRASCGVVIATGGFAHDAALREKYLPFASAHETMLPVGNSGDGLAIAQQVGAQMGDALPNNGCWTPISVRHHKDGKVTRYPHIFLDRSRPGSIMVNQSGRRFVNEATHYQALVNAMHEAAAVPCWLIANRTFVRKYGLGLVRPYESVTPYCADGYLKEGADVAGLAVAIGADPQALSETFALVNKDGAIGRDTAFRRGESVYDKLYGDASHAPNPNFAGMGDGPYYAVKIVPGDLGTFVGLKTDENAQVLREGIPIAGLYAAGLDQQSMMGGAYPGAGSMLGPAMTFGFVAARHACSPPH